MRFDKLLTALNTLSPTERKRFADYVHSPYFGAPITVVTLQEYLYGLRSNYSDKNLLPKTIVRKAPVLNTESIQAKAGSQLLVMLKDFITLEYTRQQADAMQRHRLSAFKQRHWFDWYEREYTDWQNSPPAPAAHDVVYFAQAHYLTELQYNGLDVKLAAERHTSIAPVWQSLEVYYALKKLRYYCDEIARFPNQTPLPRMDNEAYVLNLLAPFTTEEHDYVWVFVGIYQLLLQTDPLRAYEQYQSLQSFMEQRSENALSPAVTEGISYLRGCCRQWGNKGYREFSREYLRCVSFEVKHNMFHQYKSLDPVTFTNLFTNSAIVHYPPAEIALYIQVLGPLVHASQRTNRLHFAQGIFLFETGRYSDAAWEFSQVENKQDATFNALCRRWFFMSRFEETPFGYGLDASLTTFERYLQRHSHLPQPVQAAYLTFTAYAQKLLAKPLATEQTELREAIQSETHFPGREWLLEKLANGK